MNPALKALWYIESHLGGALTLDEIAAIGGVSRFHMVRAFAAATGFSVMRYVRARRLSNAARALAFGAPDILSLALEADYSSHEAFTRAFRDQFGVTPDEARRTPLSDLKLVEPIRMPDQAAPAINPGRIAKADAMLFAGLRKYFRFDDRGGIPNIWQAFGPIMATIPGAIPGAAYGLNLAPADLTDECGFDYFAAVRVRNLNDLPEGLSGARIEPRSWAQFENKGHVSNIGATCAAAGEWLARSGRSPKNLSMQMIEYYGPDFDPRTGLGGCEVWVPVE